MVTLKCKPVILASLFFWHIPLVVAEQAKDLKTQGIEVVGVTPLPSVGVPINQVPANMQVISAPVINAQKPLDVSELLNQNASSVTINDTVGNPYQYDVMYRGFTASPLLGTPQGLSVFVDGVRVNEPFGDVVNWALIPANAIADISLVPGSNPLYGLNTLGGALAVRTKSGAENPGVSASLSGGSWGRGRLAFEAGGSQEKFDYFVAGNYFHEDGWREHSKSDVRQLFSKLGWKNEISQLDLALTLVDNRLNGVQSLPLAMLSNPSTAYTWPDNINSKMAMLSLNGSHYLSEDKLVSGNLYYRASHSKSFNSNVSDDYQGGAYNGIPADANDYDTFVASNVKNSTHINGFGGGLQLTWLGDWLGHKNRFTAGVSADFGRTAYASQGEVANVQGHETVSIQPLDAYQTVNLKASNDYYGLYGTETFSFNKQWHFTASGRYNIASVNMNGASWDRTLADQGIDPVGPLTEAHHYSRFNPALGLNFNPSASLNFYGGYNEGMRAPTPVELACADANRPCALPNAFAGDPHLKEVVSRTWEGGVRGRLSESVKWNAGVFRTVNSDDIIFVGSDRVGSGYFKNVGDTLRQGIELGMSGKHEKLLFATNYSFVDATFQTPFDEMSPANSSAINDVVRVQKGNVIPSIPRHIFKMRLGYEITPNWMVSGHLIGIASQYARGDSNNQDVHGKIPGYAVLNLDTQYNLDKNWQLFVKINNLFDKNYATYGLVGANQFTGEGNSYTTDVTAWTPTQFRTPAAPRAAWIGFTYRFNQTKSPTASSDD